MTTTNDDTDGPSPIAVLDGRVTPSSNGPSADLDALYHNLADERRRRVLCYLRETDCGSARFEDLVAHLTATGDGSRRREVATFLFHVDLPALEEASLVAFDAPETVTLRSDPTLEWLLDWAVDAGDDPGGAETPSVGEWFDVLADPWRRRALGLLWRHNVVSLPDIADEVAVADRGTSITEIPPEDVLGVYDELYREHLPSLCDVGVVEYDEETDTVTLDRRALPVPSPVTDDERTER